MVVLHRQPQIVVRNDADIPHRCHGSTMQIRVEKGGNHKANFMRKNAEGSRNTSQRSFKLSL